jgi:hypothetical protein
VPCEQSHQASDGDTLPIGRIEGSKTPIEPYTPLIRYFINDIDPKRTLRAADRSIANGLFDHLIGTGKWLRRHVKAERTVGVDPALHSSPSIIWLDRLSAGASRKAEKLRNGAVVGAHRCLFREADELCGQRKFKASHHGNATTMRVLSPISLS